MATDADEADAGARHADEVNAAVAASAVCAWMGAAAVRTRHVRPVRRALDMTASIRGLRPPAWAVRGLA
jgi:dihydropteroate synthase